MCSKFLSKANELLHGSFFFQHTLSLCYLVLSHSFSLSFIFLILSYLLNIFWRAMKFALNLYYLYVMSFLCNRYICFDINIAITIVFSFVVVEYNFDLHFIFMLNGPTFKNISWTWSHLMFILNLIWDSFLGIIFLNETFIYMLHH